MTLDIYNAEGFKKLTEKKHKIVHDRQVCAVCSRQTVMQKDSIEAVRQNRNTLVQEAGLSNLAQVFGNPPSKITK